MADTGVLKLQRNDILKNKYVIEHYLGEGGLAYNYLAHLQDNSREKVVVKQTKRPQQLSTDNELADRFQIEREFRLLSELEHPNITRVYDFFEENNVAYLVREYKEGETLEKLIRSGLTINETAVISAKILEVLVHLHNKGLVYRDLKPSNILVKKGPKKENFKVFLFDFSTVRFYDPAKKGDTIALGTPGFAPPEQYGKAQTDQTADIYAFGAVLYYMLTGDNPEDSPFIFAQNMNLKRRVSNLKLARILRKCLETKPKARYQTIQSLCNDLAQTKVFAKYAGCLPKLEQVGASTDISHPETSAVNHLIKPNTTPQIPAKLSSFSRLTLPEKILYALFIVVLIYLLLRGFQIITHQISNPHNKKPVPKVIRASVRNNSPGIFSIHMFNRKFNNMESSNSMVSTLRTGTCTL